MKREVERRWKRANRWRDAFDNAAFGHPDVSDGTGCNPVTCPWKWPTGMSHDSAASLALDGLDIGDLP